jgi:hypothetical protein
MIESNESPAVAQTKPARVRTSRPKNDPTAKGADVQLAKSRDPGKLKVTLYLDVEVASKLAIRTVLRRGCDQSDVANEILGKALSSVTAYDRQTERSRSGDSPMMVGDIGSDAAA